MIRRPTAGQGIKLVRASSRIVSHWAVRVHVGTRAGNGHRVSNHYSSTWKHRNAATRPSPGARRLPQSSLRTNLCWNDLGSISGAHGNFPLLIGFPRKVSRRFILWWGEWTHLIFADTSGFAPQVSIQPKCDWRNHMRFWSIQGGAA